MSLEHRREHNAVEHDIVLAYEMHEFRIFRLPPFLPRLRKKFLRVGDISYRSVKPDIEDLTLCPLNRHRHSPIKVTAHRPRLKPAINPALALAVDIGLPLLVPFQNPLRKPFLILVQRQIPMFCRLLHKWRPAKGRLRVDQLIRAESRAALLALIAVCPLSSTARAGAYNVAVSKKGLGLLVVVLLAFFHDELAVVVEFAEEIRSGLFVHL